MTDVSKKNVGHRFQKGHPYHPPKQPRLRSEYERLKKKFIRALKKDYGPHLTAPQIQHITNAAGIKARLELQGEQLDHVTYAMLVNAQRRELRSL
jgi:hypothetical protein